MTLRSPKARLNSKSIPGAGMRGGLGRTLLTAFLLLGIVPLSLISFVAATQTRRNLQQEVEEKLVTISSLTESEIYNWIASQQLTLAVLSNSVSNDSHGDNAASAPSLSSPSSTASRFFDKSAMHTADVPTSVAWLIVDKQGQVLATYPSLSNNRAFADIIEGQQMPLDSASPIIQPGASGSGESLPGALMFAQPMGDSGLTLIALLDPQNLIEAIDTSSSRNENSEIYLVTPSRQVYKLRCLSTAYDPQGHPDCSDQGILGQSAAIEAALSGKPGTSAYDNHQGTAVIGAYRWLPELNMALLVEQTRDSALATSDDLAVVLIGATLAVVLLTALIASLVTRRITLPIVQLTATAVEIASGDLNQKVPATRRDEIGILARAFNVMTTKLRILYEDLEQKVRERTQQLSDANAKTRYRAMQLAISAEVGRVVTSILDRDLLLSKVVELIRDCFQAYFVAIFFIDESGQWAVFQDGSGALGKRIKSDGYRVDLSHDILISQAVKSLKPSMLAGSSLNRHTNRDFFPHTHAELAVPLKIGDRIIGVLDVHSTHEDAFDADEIMVLEILSGQVVVAIENARVYEIERKAAEQLRELEQLRRRFLRNMSRELRMPLNNIIGFSRVILKGIDGPITDLQREDLNAIHQSGQQLLVLINDILDIAQIEAGEMELDIRPVDFSELAHSVIPTANALVQGQPITFHFEIRPNLPHVLADPYRLRQVLVKLLSNAAKFTQDGEITLCVWPEADHIVVSISDTGIGIPEKDREKVFEMFSQVSQPGQPEARGTGLGLTFSKEIVEMHGGTIWLESNEEKGTVFTITLPVVKRPDDDN